MAIELPAPDVQNEWRLETPGQEGWTRSTRLDAEDDFDMVSADSYLDHHDTATSVAKFTAAT